MQSQPESNIRIIVDLLRRMTPTISRTNTKHVKRTGLGMNAHQLPPSFDSDFDTIDADLESNLYKNGEI